MGVAASKPLNIISPALQNISTCFTPSAVNTPNHNSSVLLKGKKNASCISLCNSDNGIPFLKKNPLPLHSLIYAFSAASLNACPLLYMSLVVASILRAEKVSPATIRLKSLKNSLARVWARSFAMAISLWTIIASILPSRSGGIVKPYVLPT